MLNRKESDFDTLIREAPPVQAMPAQTHSAKTMRTITEMNTNPEDWGICPTTVRAETRDMHLPTTCPGCRGQKYRYDYLVNNLPWETRPAQYLKTVPELCEMFPEVEAQFQLWLDEPRYSFSPESGTVREYGLNSDKRRWEDLDCAEGRVKWFRERGTETNTTAKEILSDNNWANGRGYGGHPCQDCIGVRGKPTGKVMVWTENVKCNVHYPAWPEGTKFDGRYGMGGCTRCDACAKSGIKTGTIPVLAKGHDGNYHGLFVGNACVKKFGLTQFKTVDQQATKHVRDFSKKNYSKDTGEYLRDIVVELYAHTYNTLDGVDVEEVEHRGFF